MKLLSLLLLLSAISCSHGEQEIQMSSELKSCPSSPNCVVSLFPEDKKHYIEPVAHFGGAMAKIKNIVMEMGMEIVEESSDYIYATATSSFFRFVDDVQIKVIEDKIHFRSQSRTGYSDFGVNRKRIKKIKSQLP